MFPAVVISVAFFQYDTLEKNGWVFGPTNYPSKKFFKIEQKKN